MLAEPRLRQLQELISSATKEELIWINGYLQGLIHNGHGSEGTNGKVAGVLNGNELPKTDTRSISLVYGTETGNAKKLAGLLSSVSRKKGIHMKLIGLDQYRLTDLSREDYFFVIISTQGEGEPPVNAKKFYDYIYQNDTPQTQLKYAVLGLGDTAYPQFCKTGEDVDQQLERLGGKRLMPLQKCDLDYDDDAASWFEKVIGLLEEKSQISKPPAASAPKKSGGKKIYHGKILANINLNDRGSGKQTYHIEIGTGEVVDYEPGDAIAIVPGNRKAIVDEILQLTGISPELVIETARTKSTVEDLLLSHLNICYLLSSTIKKYASLTAQDIPDTRMDLIDLLKIYPIKDAGQFEEVIKLLTPIAPRLYSISSSPAAHPGEVHITVARNYFYANEEQRLGLCSEFLGDLPEGSSLHFYVHKNRSFKLPHPDKDIIMIGPGTGIAPMRSFLAERDINGGKGRNWLFFGEQHFVSDFLYQTEIQQFAGNGVLNKVSLAFSRDQAEKIYVQHRMEEEGRELYEWITSGAHIYISGSKEPMSVDVEQTWIKLVENFGNKTKDEAAQFWETLKKEGRYQKDVY